MTVMLMMMMMMLITTMTMVMMMRMRLRLRLRLRLVVVVVVGVAVVVRTRVWLCTSQCCRQALISANVGGLPSVSALSLRMTNGTTHLQLRSIAAPGMRPICGNDAGICWGMAH